MFKDEDKSAKEKVLQEIMGMMDSHTGDKLKGMKGNPKAVEVMSVKAEPLSDNGVDAEMTKSEPEDDSPEHEAAESTEQELAEHAEGGIESSEEPSDEDKNMIKELFNRWCK